MSETEAKRSRIKDKIAASQARLRRETATTSPVRRKLPDGELPQDYRSLVSEYPWLTIAGGLAAGLVIGALLPKSVGSKLGRRAAGLATVAAELGLAYSRQAREAAGEVANSSAARVGELGHQIDESTADLRGRARRQAGVAVNSTRSVGQRVVREAIKLAKQARS